MYPTLPLTYASIRDLCESTDYLFTEAGYGDKIYLHNTFTTHSYNNESLILVDTSVPRTVRLDITVNVKKSVVIKDITGNAGVNPILISLIGPPAPAPLNVTLQGLSERQYVMYVPWGSLEVSANRGFWTVTVPRSTCISNRGFRLPQNLNLALPPAIGASRQHFKSLAFFPGTMAGKDLVPSYYNGFTASVHTTSQILLGDPVNSSLTSLFGYPDPPATTGKEFSDLSIVNDLTLNIPTDCADLAAAFLFLSNKTIMPGVAVTLTLPASSAITNLLVVNHPQASAITIQGIDPVLFVPTETAIFSASPGAVLMDVFLSPQYLAELNPAVGNIVLIDETTAPFTRWNGAWQIVSLTRSSLRLQITDWGPNFPTIGWLPETSRFRLMQSYVTVTGPNQLQLLSEGLTINNVAFVGVSQSVHALYLNGEINLHTVSTTGFGAEAIYAGYQGIINAEDLFSCSNATGLTLDREAILNADLSPSATGIYLCGNTNGLCALNSQSRLNPLYAVGNGANGIALDKTGVVEILNSYLQNNALGLAATTEGVALGNTNTITGNTAYDIIVSDGALVKMSVTSALNLSSPNGLLNPDGSRIDLL